MAEVIIECIGRGCQPALTGAQLAGASALMPKYDVLVYSGLRLIVPFGKVLRSTVF